MAIINSMIKMRKSIEGQYFTLEFADPDLEKSYQAYRFRHIMKRPLLFTLSLINVTFLTPLVMCMFRAINPNMDREKQLASLVVFILTLISEILIMAVRSLRFMRGICYVFAVSFIYTYLREQPIINHL